LKDDKSKDNDKNNPIDVQKLTGHSISVFLASSARPSSNRICYVRVFRSVYNRPSRRAASYSESPTSVFPS
jgi:hypothetical protein